MKVKKILILINVFLTGLILWMATHVFLGWASGRDASDRSGSRNTIAGPQDANIPKERKKNEAVVLMGHGTHHPSNAFYAALMFQVRLKDPNVFIGTVEGYPELDTIQMLLKKNGIKKLYLMPFMSGAGDHAKNDMAGDEEDSWKSILTKAGYQCVPILKGTAEFDNFVQIWVDHLDGALGHF